VLFGRTEVAGDDDAAAGPFGDLGALILARHLAPDLRAGSVRQLAGEVADAPGGAVDQHLAAEQQAALAQRVQRGEAGDRQGRGRRVAAPIGQRDRRLALRAAVLLYYGVREIDEELGAQEYRLHGLCTPILQMGAAAVAALAAIPDTPELVEADGEFLAAHPPFLDRATSPLTGEMRRAWHELSAYLSDRTMRELEHDIALRRTAGNLAPPVREAMQPSGEFHLNPA
jgi:hypothetical protein